MRHTLKVTAVRSEELSSVAIRAQIKKLEESPVFGGSVRLLALLHFVVNETLAGKEASLTESLIGSVVYKRIPAYDPRIDSTVRVEARRLRRKLETYYEGGERGNEIQVTLPVGAYIPKFTATRKIPAESQYTVETGRHDIFEKGHGTSVAVMPFRSLSLDRCDDNFADGLTDELIYALDRAPGLRVTARSLAFKYKNRTYSLLSLSAELNVDAVLHGTVRREGATIRITMESADARGLIVWSDRFDLLGTGALHMQERVAASVLSRLQFDSSPMRRNQVRPRPMAVEAHGKIYRARRLLDQQTLASIRQALQLFTETANSAPDYARGHAGMADCHCDLYRLGFIDHETASARASVAASRAFAIDPESLEVNAARANIFAWLDRDPAAAEAAFVCTLGLGENARACRLYGLFLTVYGRYEEGGRILAKARDIEPYSAQQDIAEAVAQFQSRRYAHSIVSNTTPRVLQTPLEAVFFRALTHIFVQDIDGARSCVAGIGLFSSKDPESEYASAEIQAWLGTREPALRLLNSTEAASSNFARATLAAALGEEDTCLDALEAAVSGMEFAPVWMHSDSRFDTLRNRPRFAQVLARSLAGEFRREDHNIG